VIRRAEIAAPAKINLWLRVLGRREDGYHDIDTLFQAIDLADDVTVARVGGSGVDLDVRGAHLGPVEENLAYRAAVAARAALGLQAGLRVSLVKRVPVGAGLGGGSSDAAAVLRCVAALVGAPRNEPRLVAAAGALGSDVPFFLGDTSLARGTGRGEILEPLEALPPKDLVLVSPPVHVATGEAYRALSEARSGAGPRAGFQDDGPGLAPEAPGPIFRSGDAVAWEAMVRASCNDFEPLTARRHPEVARALAGLRGAGAELVRMTGSGSSCFGLFSDSATARRAAEDLGASLGWACRPARTLTFLPEPRVE